MIMKKVLFGLSACVLLAACNTEGQQVNTQANSSNEEADVIVDESDSNVTGESEESNDTNGSENDNGSSNETEQNEDLSVYEFDLDIEWNNGAKWEYDYEQNDEAEIERENGQKEEVKGEEAREEIEELLGAITVTADRSPEEMMHEILDVLDIDGSEIKDFDIEVEYNNGEKVAFGHEIAGSSEDKTVRDFDLNIDFLNDEDWEFEYERNQQKAEIERDNGEEVKVTGEEAMTEMEELLASITISTDRTILEMKQEVLEALGVDESEVDEFDLDIEYEDGEEIKIKHDIS